MTLLSCSDAQNYVIGTFNGTQLLEEFDPTYSSHVVVEMDIADKKIIFNSAIIVEDSYFERGEITSYDVDRVLETCKKVFKMRVDQVAMEVDHMLRESTRDYDSRFRSVKDMKSSYRSVFCSPHGERQLFIIELNN